ncbi:Histone H2B family and Histone core domain and Histone-fold domain-containing protein [Strongyloides ratti]|uniref:Histone H2B family and Histone core domain and Histone-fold domain-containing protein n=1 Tax=Strongyloides ratti TaxID=34506 RepID=A0A090L6A0_STRRB|nr:Histone H2B family and Histone core domain and Histone-fold domain-containing protein [Strongyloides ratti]CEF65247.1 Histone H2B family and Histone core domain and Histone-fold domain-containing protein [Strongyloides ratti]
MFVSIYQTWKSCLNFLKKICYGNNNRKKIIFIKKYLDTDIESDHSIEKDPFLRKKVVKKCKAKKRVHKRRYSKEIKKILKRIYPDFKISFDGIDIMNCLINDVFDQIVLESSRLCHISNRKTIMIHDIEYAVKLIFPKKLSEKAIENATKSKDCIYNDGRFSCIGENTFTSSIYQRPSDDLILHKCCTFWHQTKDMQKKLKFNSEIMNCFNYEVNFNSKTKYPELYTDNFNENNLDPLKIKNYFTTFDNLDENKEIIFIKKIQPKKYGYYLMLCKNECIKKDNTIKNQTILTNFLLPSSDNINKKNVFFKNFNFSRNLDLRIKLENDKKKKYKFLKINSKELKSKEWEDISQSIKMATFKRMLYNLEKHFKQNNTTKNNKMFVFKVNSTIINLPALSFVDKNINNESNSLSLLFDNERKLKNMKKRISINGNVNKVNKENIKLSKIIIPLQTTTPFNDNFIYFKTRQNGLKIKIIPEKSNEITQITTSSTPITQVSKLNNDETLTVENLPLNLLMKIVQEHNMKENKIKSITSTTTPEPNDKKLKDEVLNLQKQLLLILLKDKEENKSKENILSLISKETLVKLLSNNNEQKHTTTTTTTEPTTKERVILELPKEVLQLLINANKISKQENTKKENDSNEKEKENNDEKISLSAVTLLKLLTTNLKNQSNEKNKSNEEDKIVSKNILITTSISPKKVYKSAAIIRSDGSESDEDIVEEYGEETEKTTRTTFLRKSKSKRTTKRALSLEYEEASDEKVEQRKIKTSTRSKFRKIFTQTTKKKVVDKDDSSDYEDNSERTKNTKSTKKLSKAASAAAVTIITSSESNELITSTTRNLRKLKQRNRHSTISHHKRNRKRMNRHKGLFESFNSSQFLINLIPRIKETFGIEPQVHPTEKKANIIPYRYNTTLDN